ncbi:hypothetical protein EJB05_54297, partial [Eragrostis curvula]
MKRPAWLLLPPRQARESPPRREEDTDAAELSWHRYGMRQEFERLRDEPAARAVYERLVRERPRLPGAFVRYAEFEARHGEASRAREVYERAVDVVGDLAEEEEEEEEGAELLFLSFAGFEEACGAPDRARAVYKRGLERLPEWRADELRRRFRDFERLQHDAEVEKSIGEGIHARATCQLAVDSAEKKAAKGVKRKKPITCVPSNPKILDAAYAYKSKMQRVC